jgi:hypothetical protein
MLKSRRRTGLGLDVVVVWLCNVAEGDVGKASGLAEDEEWGIGVNCECLSIVWRQTVDREMTPMNVQE